MALLLDNLFSKTIWSNPWIISRRKAWVLVALLAVMCPGPFAAQAKDFDWQRDSGGDWFGNGNWSGGPNPTSSSDTATFTKNNDPGSPAPAPVNLLSESGSPNVPIIGTLNLNVGGYMFQNGTLQLGGAATINVQSHNPFADFAANATIQLLNDATINTSLANSTLSVTGGITGAFGLTKTGPGTLTLSGTNTYTGNTAVTAGTLIVNGSIGAGSVNVSSAATLGGEGTIGGPVNIQNGGILSPGVGTVPGASPAPGTLTVGSLTLSSGSILNYEFGIPNVVNSGINDLVNVMGNLTLAGTLNVTDVGGFGAGVYRVFNYSGSLTNNTLQLGSLPAGFGFSVDTAHAGQVNLVVSGALPDQFWDGSNTTPGNIAFGRGGNGTWNNVTTNTNWTTEAGTSNAAWGNGFAIFAGTAGTVTLGDNIHFTGMQFLTTGYLIGAPGSQTLLAAPDTIIRTDVGVTATISAPIANDSGPAKLTKTDAGTLVLVGNNTYTGGTTIEDGTLQLGNGGITGSVMGDVVDDSMLAISRSDSFTFGGTISGTGSLTQIGPGTLVLTAANSYTGDTIINGGILSIATAANIGATDSLTFNGGTLLTTGNVTTPVPVLLNASGTIDNGGSTDTFSGIFSGAGGLTSKGAGTLILTANNDYTGATTITAGTLQLGDGTTNGSIIGNVTDNGTLAFDPAPGTTMSLGGVISGSGSVNQIGTGTTVLTGANSYTGSTTVSAGALYVNGDQTATGATTVQSGATLGGTGTLGGNVTIASGGTLAPGGVGGAIGTLAINGNLGLTSGSILNYSFGQANTVGGPFNDLTVVKGNLTLAGTLNVALTPGGTFDPGIYRVISYNGTLTNNGLTLGATPPGSTEVVQTSVPNQVNLVVTTGLTLNFWDGALAANKNNNLIDGGNGTWQISTGNDNWTTNTGALNAPWTNAAFAIFEAAPGTVTVDNGLGQVTASGMQFASNGYLITGGPITLVETTTGSGQTIIRVGDGTAAGAAMTATIASVLQGGTQLVKTDLGTLVLSGVNTYSGGTAISGGTLQLGDGGAIGSILGNVVDNATLAFDRSSTYTFGGLISGNGTLVQIGFGTTILTADNTYTGGTVISAGTLQIGNGGTTGSVTGNVTDSGTLAFDRRDAINFAGAISGTGSLIQLGSGTLILTGNNTYSGGTEINTGTLQVGIGGTTGNIIGNVTDNGTLAFNRSGNKKTFDGVISGSGSVMKLGSDTLVLTANNTYSGGTTIEDGTLVAGVPIAGQATSFALGTGDVLLQGGILRTPSLDPLIINVGRNYTQGPNGTLAIGVAGVDGRDYDRVQVQGNASLNGTVAVSSLNNFQPVNGNVFEILRTGGTRSGEFATITDNLNTNPHLHRFNIYAPNGFALLYLAHPGPPTPPTDDVEPFPLPPVQSDKPLPSPALVDILDPTVEQLTSIFEVSFSGANTQRFKLDERFDEIQRGSTGFVSNLPSAPAPVESTAAGKSVVEKQPVLQPTRENRWGVWANGWGDWVSISNDDSVKGYDFTTGGFIIGVDYRITDQFALGLMGGYAHTATDLQPSGNIDVNTGRGGLYATYFDHGFYINAVADGGRNSYNTSRQELLGSANGSTSSGEFSTWTEAGYDFHIGSFTVGPLGALQYTLVHVDGFNEQGSLLPLHIHSDQEASLRTDLGGRATYTWRLGSVLVIPTLTAAWEHEYFYTALPITANFVAFPGQSATLFGPSEGHDSAIVNAGAAFQLTARLSTYLGYQGQLGRDRYNANAVTGGFSFSF
jgi:fibronectin-binding autotransporter adhesin